MFSYCRPLCRGVFSRVKSNPDDRITWLRTFTRVADVHQDKTNSHDHNEAEEELDKTDIVCREESPRNTPPKPYTRRPLALSPLLDPNWVGARQKHSQPKKEASRTALQIELSKNPYAQALATPTRFCIATLVALPSFFLQDFEYVAHPETKQPWLMPRSLTSNAASRQTSGPKAYVVARQDLLNSPQRAYIDRIERAATRGKAGKGVSFRNDMHNVVLPLLRQRLVEGLLHLAGRDGSRSIYLSRCERQRDDSPSHDWDSFRKKRQVGAVLWMGQDSATPSAMTTDIPGEFATFDLMKESKTKIPVYNLLHLLGDENLKTLKETAPAMFDNVQIIAIKAKSVTTEIQLKLWRLQGYVACHEEYGGQASKKKKPNTGHVDGDEEEQ